MRIYLLQLSTVLKCKGFVEEVHRERGRETQDIYWSSVLLVLLNFTTMTVMLSGHPL